MTLPTSFSSGKPEAPATRASAAVADAVHNAEEIDALQLMGGLALLLIIVCMWLQREDDE